MNYFITGGTGFIGRFLIPLLLDRGGIIHMLVRPGSEQKVEDLRHRHGVSSKQLIAVKGDLLKKNLGVSAASIKKLKTAGVDHFFHLAAIYDIEASAEAQIKSNVEGTEQAIALAGKLAAGSFHHVSSIAAAGLYHGSFTEDMFEQATGLDNPYFQTKHDSERLVREMTTMPWRIYRPGIVVGDSVNGEIDKIDGPYFFFPAIKAISKSLPSWLRSLMIGGGKLNIVPVDYVVTAMDHLAHLDQQDNQCFYLTQDEEINVGELVQVLLKVAKGPSLTVVAKERSALMIERTGKLLAKVPGVSSTTAKLMRKAGIPAEAIKFVTYPTHFDSSKTRALLYDAGIHCPEFADYAEVLWDYWLQQLDTPQGDSSNLISAFAEVVENALKGINPRQLQQALKQQVVLVTGATSGIGHQAALKLADAGAHVILVARSVDKLHDTLEQIESLGGQASCYSCDIADTEDCERLVEQVLNDHGRVDILINNAGRSIRRSVEHSFERFHDYERTMQLNYFGALKLIMGFTPGMLERGHGQVINISSIGVLASPPRFSAYVASKSALDAFSWCAAAEFAHRNVAFTTINMPLVKTPMIAPTKLYDAFPTLTPDQAANLVMKAIIDKPKRIATKLGLSGAVLQALAPNTSEFILNKAYHLFPDSAAARGDGSDTDKAPRSAKDLARQMFAQVFPGVHW